MSSKLTTLHPAESVALLFTSNTVPATSTAASEGDDYDYDQQNRDHISSSTPPLILNTNTNSHKSLPTSTLSHIESIPKEYLNCFNIIHTRLHIPQEYKVESSTLTSTSSSKKQSGRNRSEQKYDEIRIEASKLYQDLRRQHNSRAKEIISANRKSMLYYWSLAQKLKKAKRKENVAKIESPDCSFTMIPSKFCSQQFHKNCLDSDIALAIGDKNSTIDDVENIDGSVEEDKQLLRVIRFKEPLQLSLTDIKKCKIKTKRSQTLPTVVTCTLNTYDKSYPELFRTYILPYLTERPSRINNHSQAACSVDENGDINGSSLGNILKKADGNKFQFQSNSELGMTWKATVPISHIPIIVPLPKSFHNSLLSSNFRGDDDPVLRYVPYFGDNDTTGFDMSAYDATPDQIDADLGGEILETAVYFMMTKHSNSELNAYFTGSSSQLDKGHDDNPSKIELVLMKAYNLSLLQLRRCNERGREYHNSQGVTHGIQEAKYLGSSILLPFLGIQPVSIIKESDVVDNLGLRNTSKFEVYAETYVSLFCRRCFIYDCKLHATQQPKPIQSHPPKIDFKTMTFTPRSLTDPNANADNISSLASLPRCGDDFTFVDSKDPSRKSLPYGLYNSNVQLEVARGVSNKRKLGIEKRHFENLKNFSEWSALEKSLSGKLIEIFGEKDPQSVALCLGTCLPSQVDMLSQSQSTLNNITASKTPGAESPVSISVDEEAEYLEEIVDRADAAKGLIKRSVYGVRMDTKKPRIEFRPCCHDGPCTLRNCRCLQLTGYCEKYCPCGITCKYRFPGCKCKSTCQSKACPCIASSRECDPDLCLTCGVSIHPSLRNNLSKKIVSGGHHVVISNFNSVDDNEKTNSDAQESDSQSGDGNDNNIQDNLKVCRNCNIRLGGFGKKVSIGRSSIHGWGAFIREDAHKHDYICEYIGEIISQDEADRRGKIYDKLGSSYLFNLNEELVVDAARKGNKAKFLNHSKDPNCYTRIMQVGVDHRIGIYAKKNLVAGEELTFDYSYAEECAPTWTNRKEKNLLKVI